MQTIAEYLCSLCCNHNAVISSFIVKVAKTPLRNSFALCSGFGYFYSRLAGLYLPFRITRVHSQFWGFYLAISLLCSVLGSNFSALMLYKCEKWHGTTETQSPCNPISQGINFVLVCMSIGIYCICDSTVLLISPRGRIWAHKTSLTPPLFIVVTEPSQGCELSCIGVLEVSICYHFYDFCIKSWNSLV